MGRTHVALLRGINVGGRNRVAMADLRDLVASLGHTDVATYIQSGNVVFTAADSRADTTDMADALERAIACRLSSVRPKVVVMTRAELSRAIRSNPFADESDPKAVHAVFSTVTPDRDRITAIAAAVQRSRARGSPDQARAVGRTLYLWTPDGIGRSKLAADLTRGTRGESAPAHAGTARNLATVLALQRLLDEDKDPATER